MGCFAGHCDRRRREITELATLGAWFTLHEQGRPAACNTTPCIDPDSAAVAGPTAHDFTESIYWSASAVDTNPSNGTWTSWSLSGQPTCNVTRTKDYFVRAVRFGSRG